MSAVAEAVQQIFANEWPNWVRYKDITAEELAILKETTSKTLATPEVKVELIRAVTYVVEQAIPGDFVECGTYVGGNAIIMIRTLQNLGINDRTIWLYDTFEGFPEPETIDYEYGSGSMLAIWRQHQAKGERWLEAPIDGVRNTLRATGYPEDKVILIKGMVEETIPRTIPGQIALLRLDTDFYRSTKHELIHLYPRLVKDGVLIIDDYGAIHGAKVATDEYFRDNNIAFRLNRIDEHVRAGVKTT